MKAGWMIIILEDAQGTRMTVCGNPLWLLLEETDIDGQHIEDARDQASNKGSWNALSDPRLSRYRLPRLLTSGHGNDVSCCAHRRCVTSESNAQCESPPQRAHGNSLCLQTGENGEHGNGEGDIVDNR